MAIYAPIAIDAAGAAVMDFFAGQPVMVRLAGHAVIASLTGAQVSDTHVGLQVITSPEIVASPLAEPVRFDMARMETDRLRESPRSADVLAVDEIIMRRRRMKRPDALTPEVVVTLVAR